MYRCIECRRNLTNWWWCDECTEASYNEEVCKWNDRR